MIRILCYGDSNTWGTIPDGTCRHCDIDKAYPAILQRLLGEGYCVISAGMPARTACSDDYKFPKGNRNGALVFPQILISAEPIDYVVLMIGTNDMKSKFNKSVEEVVNAIEKDYIKHTREHLAPELAKTPKFIIMCPATVDEGKFDGFEGATAKTALFEKYYSEMAKRNGCLYLSNEGYVCGDDGLHLVPESHELIAKRLAELIKKDCR